MRKVYSYMRIILFYDLPFDNKDDTKNYTKFRSNILKLGYIQIQYSIYARVVQNKQMVQQHVKKVEKVLPPGGSIRIIVLTEKQYNEMIILRGEMDNNEIINDCKRFREI